MATSNRDFRRRLLIFISRRSGGGKARGLLRIWPLWERLANRLWPAVEAPESPRHLVALHVKQHRGASVAFKDGTRVEPGDWVGEIHLNNHEFVRALTEDGGQATGTDKFAIIPMFKDELAAITRWIESGTMPHPVKALVGVTVLGRGAVRVGFEMRPRQGRFLPYLDKLFVDGLMIVYTPEGVDRMMFGKTVGDQSEEAWMPLSTLLRRYGAVPEESSAST